VFHRFVRASHTIDTQTAYAASDDLTSGECAIAPCTTGSTPAASTIDAASGW